MLKATNKPSPENNAPDRVTTLLGRVGFPPLMVLRTDRGESKPKPPWKQFDDTHHWDSAAEEWIPNDLP